VEILVLHPGALGDIILALPALAALRRHFERSLIVLGGNLDYLPFSAWGYADRVLTLSTLPAHRLFAAGPLPDRDVAWWRAYDRVVSWTGADHPEFTQRLTSIIPSALVSSWRPVPGDRRHVSRIFLESLHSWIGPPERIEPPAIRLCAEAMAGGRAWLKGAGWDCSRKLVALHPGASAAPKRWPLASFAAAARALQACDGAGVVVLEGPAEAGLGSLVVRDLDAVKTILAKSLPLELLAAILSCCSAYLGNDSGVSHLAAGLGLRTVVIFGPTPPEQWAPLGPEVRVLRDPGDCRACRLVEPEGHTCLGNITCESVLENLR